MKRTTRISVLTAVVGLVGGAILVAAGPLNPLPGAVTSTYKTLSEVQPRTAISSVNTQGDATSVYKIVQPGSYYLTGNVTVPSGKNGIMIAAPNVTVDMGGFVISGVAGSLNGIMSNSSVVGGAIVVKGGTIANMGSRGIDFNATANTTMTDIVALNCGSDGIDVSQYSDIRRCTAYGNGGNGISAGYGAMVSACVSYNNTGIGIIAGNVATVADCIATGNESHGIRVTYGCVATGNNCGQNGASGTGAGIDVFFGGNHVEGNTFSNNPIGLRVESSGNVIVRNVAKSNTTNWSIVANNVYGTIVDRSGPASAAVAGNSAASSLGTSDANANVTY